MEYPNINNIMIDEKRDIRYNVMAYKKLNATEMIESIRYYHHQKKKKIKKGDTVTIITTIGFDS